MILFKLKAKYHIFNNIFFLPPFFSLPSLLPKSKTVLCPMSGKPIKMNDLVTVCFTPLDPTLSRVALLTRQVGFSQHLISFFFFF